MSDDRICSRLTRDTGVAKSIMTTGRVEEGKQVVDGRREGGEEDGKSVDRGGGGGGEFESFLVLSIIYSLST